MKKWNQSCVLRNAGVFMLLWFLFGQTGFAAAAAGPSAGAEGSLAPENPVSGDSPPAFKEFEGSFHIDPAPPPPGIRPLIPLPWQKFLEDASPLSPVEPESAEEGPKITDPVPLIIAPRVPFTEKELEDMVQAQSPFLPIEVKDQGPRFTVLPETPTLLPENPELRSVTVPAPKEVRKVFRVEKTNRRGGSAAIQVRTIRVTNLKTEPPRKTAWWGNWRDQIENLAKDVKIEGRKNKVKAKLYADREMRRG